MLIRREQPADAPAIARVHASAFAAVHGTVGAGTNTQNDPTHNGQPGPEPVEVGLVERLRSDPAWIATLSLVAMHVDEVVGHVCLTRAAVGPFPALALGPLGVHADHQRAGVGSALMHAAIGAADALDEPLIGLLGSLEYYPRFGFVPSARLGITPDEPGWVSHFQVRPLTAFEPQISGEFHYAEPFYEL
ncbi:N-acetyltransferase [Nocardia higoensis]|uniref:N-acetyltransferase n=1 Tax=Nocardia higoensis TaxID=228599 RepID=A0ABS0DG92_9NOCA|nr:N-acetyltransferase [Nocardia higoensis]MBF6357487.1 N-acetyltransferase [Nocardia higoensis]